MADKELEEDVAEIIIGHFPNASRRVMQEMSEEVIELITSQIVAELEEFVGTSQHGGFRSLADIRASMEARINQLKNGESL